MEVKRIINLIILDASGSMDIIYNQALSGVNETIQTIRIGQKDHPELQQFLTLASFNSGKDYLKVKYSTTPIAEVKELTHEDYVACGCTALYDAMGEMISELKRNVTLEDRVLVTVITDGYENSSTHWSGPQIKSLVEELRHEGWTFTYIGANQNVEAVAGSMGIRNSMAFEETPMGSKKMFDIDRRCRASFYKKIRLHKADKCCEEDIDYFETK
ncbi:MAG: VWA domain-containing protein [Prevotella sp.]|nr:VWA domain-containing protein [Prevotella sp.]